MLLFNWVFFDFVFDCGFLGFYLGLIYFGIFYIEGGGFGGLFLFFFDWDCCLERYCIVKSGELGILRGDLDVVEELSFLVDFEVISFDFLEFIFWRREFCVENNSKKVSLLIMLYFFLVFGKNWNYIFIFVNFYYKFMDYIFIYYKFIFIYLLYIRF